VAQEALLTFATRYRRGAYDRRRGRLRDWLFGIVRRTLRGHRRAALRRRELQPTESGDRTGYFARLADPAQLSQSWEEEWRAAVLRQCLEEARQHVEQKTIEAFELLAWRGWPAAKVASHLGLSENAVYIAKHRVLRRMRALLPQITEVW
jgi:RNA polymerase sigma-70 factor (ECF subfamily)